MSDSESSHSSSSEDGESTSDSEDGGVQGEDGPANYPTFSDWLESRRINLFVYIRTNNLVGVARMVSDLGDPLPIISVEMEMDYAKRKW